MPSLELPGLKEHYKEKKLEKISFKSYASNDFVLKKEDVYELLQKGNFLVHK